MNGMNEWVLDAAVAPIWAPLESAPVSAYLLREVPSDFILEAVNAAARARAPGLVKVLGHGCTQLYRDQPQIIEFARECMRTKAPISCEVTVRRHDRLEADQRQRMAYIHLPPDRLIIFAADVNAAENLAAALSESDERYRSLLASLPHAVLLRGADERVLTCNDVAVELFGHHTAAEILGQVNVLSPNVQVTGENGEPVPADAFPSRRVVRGGEPVRDEVFSVRGPDNQTRFVRVSAEPLRTRTGQVGGSVTLYVDDTDRIQAQRSEREAAARLEMALEAASMGIWEWTPEGGAGSCSKSLARLFDVPEHPQAFASLLSRVHPEDTEGVLQWAKSASQRLDGQTSEHEFRVVGNDEKVRWARVRGRREPERGQAVLSGTLADVTARRQLEDSLREGRHLESVGRLAGGIAHDFNNLLTAMLGSLEMLADVCPVSAREDLATVRAGAERARDLTAQLLAFARKQSIILEAVDVGHLLYKAERLLLPLLGSRIALSISGPVGLTVRADPSQLEQVLVNLAANARDTMPGGGRLELRLSSVQDPARGELVVLDVTDTGPGIAQSALPHVFDPFFGGKVGSSNLALASCYGIVKQHGGDISVQSQVGKGTRFRIALPKSTGSSSLPPPVAAPIERKGCILVVDDEESVRNTTCRLLKSLGYEVLSAENGQRAVDVVQHHPGPIDVLLCDVAMPGENGPEVAQRVLGVRASMRVLFVSGYPEGENVVSTHGFLQKPYTRATLSEKLTSLWVGPSARR